MIYYTYKMTDLKTGQFYIGKKSATTKTPEKDWRYRGGGMWPQECARNKKFLAKEILKVFSTLEECEKEEISVIYQHRNDILCMNIMSKFPGLFEISSKNSSDDSIEVRHKSVCGIDRFYPENRIAEAILGLKGSKTFSYSDLCKSS